MSNAKSISVLEILKHTLTAARDSRQPESVEQLIPCELKNLRTGIQIGIDAIDREIRLLRNVADPEQAEASIAELGEEAALTFGEDHTIIYGHQHVARKQPPDFIVD